jgi:hypothetical protein
MKMRNLLKALRWVKRVVGIIILVGSFGTAYLHPNAYSITISRLKGKKQLVGFRFSTFLLAVFYLFTRR